VLVVSKEGSGLSNGFEKKEVFLEPTQIKEEVPRGPRPKKVYKTKKQKLPKTNEPIQCSGILIAFIYLEYRYRYRYL
jgi:hypothetical protein